MGFRFAGKIDITEAATLLEKSKVKSVFDCGGMLVTILETEGGDTMIVQGSGETFIKVQ